MDESVVKVSVFFQEPFWIGVFERVEHGRLSVAKVTFGAEPKEYEVDEFILKNYYKLRFSPAVKTVVKEKAVNPKRAMRQVKKQMNQTGVGKKSWQALKLQQEELKTERKTYSKEQKEADKLRKFELKQQKRKEKHKGR